MSIGWENIKPLKGSQNNAFEELVCQLARQEYQSLGKGKFTRISVPDGGIEAMCELLDGSVHGWQAKYFLSSFSTSQWRQIEDSFKEALKNYPKLTKYYVCVATDRANAHISGNQSFLTKWNKKVQEWQNFAQSQGKNIEFEFWGNFELIDLLAKPENAGKKFFWFSENELSENWFFQYNQQAISNLGPRYTPKINVDLPISLQLEGLARAQIFKEYLSDQFHKLLMEINKQYEYLYRYKELGGTFEPVYELLINKLNLLNIDDLGTTIDIHLITQKINELIKYLEDFSKNNSKNEKSNNNNDYYHFRNLINGLEDIIHLLKSSELSLFNGKVLVLTGQAGSGKSHLLGDFIQKRRSLGKYALLLLGQDFTDKSNAWSQILSKQLNLTNITPEVFLSALDSIGEMQQERVILAIDALNEGEGKKLWQNQLNGLIELIDQYSNIGLILSVRDSYQDIVFNQLNIENKAKLCYVTHTGFMDNEFEAIQIFFPYYGLQLPSAPLLNPEFSNPLYLKLFCESLKYQGLACVPKGHKGFDYIVKSYLDGIEKRICEQIEYDVGSHLVQRAINVIAKLQLEEDKYSLDYITVKRKVCDELIDDIAESDAKKFLDYLIKENIISKNAYYGKDEEYIYFNYERIGDYQKANLVLKNIHNQDDFSQWLDTEQGKNLYSRVGLDRGVWEALSVLLPEKFDFEVFEVIDCSKDWLWFDIIVENLFWRHPKTINMQKLRKFFNNNQYFNQATWTNVLYQLATEIDNPLNIKFLHNKLNSYSLADRDAVWTAFIVLESDQCPAIDRLLTWCCKSSGQENIEPEALLLGAIAVSWLFTSTHKRSRNGYINALAHLLWNRLEIALELFKEFTTVNDPYVLEGILSAIYGAVTHSDSLEGLKELSQEIDNKIFTISSNEEVYPNVLIRNYARCIIEYSLQKNEYSIDEYNLIKERITPPYKSFFPDTLPSNEDIDEKYNEPEQRHIIHSMTTEYGRGTGGYGDFGRYTFEAKFHQWESYKHGNIINVDLLSNYACQMIFEQFGYDATKHAQFEKNISHSWRRDETGKVERIGKKYQWLALYEILARVMDNFPAFIDNYHDSNERKYITNLDNFYLPRTCIELLPTSRIGLFSEYENHEQYKTSHTLAIQNDEPIDDWVQRNDFPDIENLLELTINGEQWLALERHDEFKEPFKFGQKETYDQQMWLQTRSYLVRESQYSQAKNWLSQQNFMGRWMPEGREHYNGNIISYFNDNADSEWREVYPKYERSNCSQFEVIPSVENHIWESTYGNDGLSLYAPTPIIFHQIGMFNTVKQGYWINKQNHLICFNPKINGQFKNMLLIKKEPFLNFLRENKLKLIWTILGEKHAYKQSKFLQEISGAYYLYGKNAKTQGKVQLSIKEIEHWGK